MSAIVWGIAARPDGLLNGFLQRIGIPPQPFLTSTAQALPTIIVIASWIGVGYWMMFFSAGLKEVPTEVYEAAKIDGAKWWRTTWSITLPMIRRAILFVVVADTIAAFTMFAPVQILTRGGPQGSTQLVMWDIYQRAFIDNDLPAANTETVLLMIVMLAIVAFQFRLLREDRQQ